MEQPSYSDLESLCYSQTGLTLPAQHTTVISCPKKMVGRVIGKNGETIKALQQFTGAQIQIDQRCDPTRVSIAGAPKSLQVATSMVQDIVAGTFKGFAMLRSFASQSTKAPDALSFLAQPVPVYIEGYGFVPPSQFFESSDAAAPTYQQSLHGYANDPGIPAATHGNYHALSMALAAQAQLLGTRSASPPLPDVRTQSPGFNTSPFFQTLSNLQQQQQQYPKPPIGAVSQLPSITARSLFSPEDEALKGAEKLPTSSLNSSLPSLSTSSVTPSSQANGLTVWSQLEKLSPDGGPTSGSPLLTPGNTPSRASSPIHKPVGAGVSAGLPASDSDALLAQLQTLSILKDRPRAEVTASSFYSAGWPTSAQEPAPALPQGWICMNDPENRRFYHNVHTKQSQYEVPQAAQPAVSSLLPPHTERESLLLPHFFQ